MMNDLDNHAFASLFKEAYQQCFGYPLTVSLSETESKHFGNKILEDTGLVVGAKSLKNYSQYLVNNSESKKENPSTATLDTLARYVLHAPYTDETSRKDKEGHYPYWFQYRNKSFTPAKKRTSYSRKWILLSIFLLGLTLSVLFLLFPFHSKTDHSFSDDFHTTREDSLSNHGWFIRSKDNLWWKRRGEAPSHLTLFTLQGDNWPDSMHATPNIKNLLLRKLPVDCFTAEVHIDDFLPKQNWQQAGMLLMEDTTPGSKTVRLSIAYNDFFGGYKKPKEIILQGVSSSGADFNKPEEIVHLPLFSIEPGQEKLAAENMRRSALKIEKKNNHYRFLYAAGPLENFAFKEAFSRDLDFHPKYIGLFALEGFVADTNYMPVNIKFFGLNDCK